MQDRAERESVDGGVSLFLYFMVPPRFASSSSHFSSTYAFLLSFKNGEKDGKNPTRK